MNSLVRVDLRTGRARTFVKFPKLNPAMEAVPTSISVYGDSLLVSLFGGVPFTPGVSRTVIVNPTTGEIGPFLNGLSSNTAAFQAKSAREEDRQFLALEFSANLGLQTPAAGRLILYSPNPTVAADGLVTASSMVQDPDTGDVFVSELATGRIVQVRLPR
jgi:hypothetical protein